MLTVFDLWKGFGGRDLFRGANLQVGARDRVALVGPNGSGKTTLFDMIAGRQEPDRGEVRLLKGAIVGYLEQETDSLRGRRLLDQVMAAGSEAGTAEHRLAVLEEEIAATEPGAARDRLVAEYGRLQDRFAALGGYSREADAKKILGGLGFGPEDFDRSTDTLSGGKLMRVALARLLLSAPDVLMLDEPTNHLDVESVEWLERFLSGYEGTVLLISHDRDFINRIATIVVEIDRSELVVYPGDYEAFVRQRAERIAQAEATAKNAARKVAETEAFIERFRYKASKAKQVQSRIKSLDRLDRGAQPPSERRRRMKLRFPDPPRTGRVVLELAGVDFAYGDNVVYRGLDFVLERGHKVALVGPNGAGKTTLLKLIAGALTPARGERTLGHNARLGYFAQHQIEALHPQRTVADEVAASLPRGAELKVRDLLGRFLFSGDDVDKRIAVLSGGERTRVALAKLLVSGSSVLCLDEPTNHLDIQSRDALEDALVDYAGALVLITHDRHLIRSVADHIVEVRDGRITSYEGDYEFYLAHRDPEPAQPPPNRPRPADDLSPKERRRRAAEDRARTKSLRDRVAAIERELDELQAEMARIESILGDPDAYARGEDMGRLSRSYERAKRRTSALEVEWEEAAVSLESMTAC
jgi:ATP-binding cassette, subfamily F, member 3